MEIGKENSNLLTLPKSTYLASCIREWLVIFSVPREESMKCTDKVGCEFQCIAILQTLCHLPNETDDSTYALFITKVSLTNAHNKESVTRTGRDVFSHVAPWQIILILKLHPISKALRRGSWDNGFQQANDI